MTELTDMPIPSLADAYALILGPYAVTTIGRLATGGTRRLRTFPIGRFEGRGIGGRIVSAVETLLDRPDGITVVEAHYIVRTAAGETIRLIGTGYETAAPFAGLRLTIVFEADEDGGCAHLPTRAFLAERPAGGDTLAIHIIE